MTVKEALYSSGLIFISLLCILLVYFALEPLTDFLEDKGYAALSVLSNVSVAVIIYFFVRWFNKTVNGLDSIDYGIDNRKWFQFFLIGIGVSIILLGTTLIYFLAIGEIQFAVVSDGAALITFLLGNLVVAAWEELYFRGLVVPTLLKRNMSFAWTAIISSGFFAMLHLFSYDLTTITPFWIFGVFFISSVLLFLYIKTRSIWTSIGCHFCWDSIFGAIDEAENDFGLVQMESYEPNAQLIDNISILVTGVFLLAFLILMRNRVKSGVQAYLLHILPSRQ
jgi:uncharacterized protein